MLSGNVVTIGIPIYKSVKYIERTLLSALEQTYQNIEYLLIDDCGKDGSMEIVNRLTHTHSRGKNIRTVSNRSNMGIGYCRNLIIKEAQGDFLYFLDSDDIIEPFTIQLLVDHIVRKQVQVVYASYDVIDYANKHIVRFFRKPNMFFDNNDSFAEYVFNNISVFQTMACNCLIEIGFLRGTGIRFLKVNYWEDLAFTCELITKVNRAFLIPDITYHYNCHPASLSNYEERSFIEKKEILNNIYILEYLKDLSSSLLKKAYLPYFCAYLETISVYLVYHIMLNRQKIKPVFYCYEIKKLLKYPVRLCVIFGFNHKLLLNLLLWFLGVMPPLFSIVIIRLYFALRKR